MKTQKRYSPEVKERSVRLVLQTEKDYRSRWSAIQSISSKIGCTPETLRSWVLRHEVDHGYKDGVSSSDLAKMKDLERENRELKRTNEILRKAAAFFAQAELDRKPK